MTECPSEVTLDMAISVGADAEIEAHLVVCARCRGLWDQTVDLIAHSRQLPAPVAPARLVEERRTALLAAWDPSLLVAPAQIEPTRRPRVVRWATLGLGLSLAATVATAWFAMRAPSASRAVAIHPQRGAVHPHDGARFARASQPPDEIVRLRDGVIDVDVDPLAAGERFRVIVGTDEIEVHGTSFEVVAFADRLISVKVVHGLVEVRHSDDSPIVLGAGQAWNVSIASNVEVAAPPPIVSTPIAKTHPRAARNSVSLSSPPHVSAAPDPQESAFVRGWEAMRQGDYEQSVAAFDRTIELAPGGAVVQDAMFWRAVVVARLHRTADAITAFRSFIVTFPASTRVGEASAMLGWLLIETHELDDARRRFQAAIHDNNASVRESAAQGLQALDDKQ